MTLLLLLVPASPPVAPAQLRPNIILVMTDDQGYGDIAAHGHPDLRRSLFRQRKVDAVPGLEHRHLVREALRFIQTHRHEPFFVYLPTNTAHQTRSNVPEQ